MKNKQNDKEWELGGGGTNSQGQIFVITCAKMGNNKKKNKQSHKSEWEVKKKNKLQ
jgi:hypothetical protein